MPLPYSSMVTEPHIMVGLERMLDYRGFTVYHSAEDIGMLSHALDHVTFHSECQVTHDDLAGLPTTDMTSLLHRCNLVLVSYKDLQPSYMCCMWYVAWTTSKEKQCTHS